MQAWNTVNYVSKKYALRECPIVLAQLLNTTRVRFALLQTNCYLDVQSRVLNWRHRATPWTKGAIVEVAGPNYRAIDRCNDLIETIVPFYAHRRPYVDILRSTNERLTPRNRCQRWRKPGSRSVSSLSVSNGQKLIHMSGTYHQRMPHSNYCYLTDPCVIMNDCNPSLEDDPNAEIPAGPRHARSEWRRACSQTLPERIQFSVEQPVQQDALDEKVHLVGCEPEGELNAGYLTDPTGDEVTGVHDRNEHNVTNATEVVFAPAHHRPLERVTTFPRPPLFESQRSARIAAHSLRAAAVRASLQKMKDEKYPVLRQPVPWPPQTQSLRPSKPVKPTKCYPNPPAQLGRSNPARQSRDTVTKPTGDHVGIVPVQIGSIGKNEKTANSRLIALKPIGKCPRRGRDKAAPIRTGQTLAAKPESPDGPVDHVPDKKAQPMNADPNEPSCSYRLMTTDADPYKMTTDDVNTTDALGMDRAGSSDETSIVRSQHHVTSDSTKRDFGDSAHSDAAGSLIDNNISLSMEVMLGTGIEGLSRVQKPQAQEDLEQEQQQQQQQHRHQQQHQQQPQIKPSDTIPRLACTYLNSPSDSNTSRLLDTSETSDHAGPEDVAFIASVTAREYPVKFTRCASLETVQAIGKTVTDTAEYNIKQRSLQPRRTTRLDSNLLSDVSSVDTRLSSLHMLATTMNALAPTQTMLEPHSITTEKNELIPNPLLTSVVPGLPVARVTGSRGVKINVADMNDAKQVTHLRAQSPGLHRAFRPKLFERLEGYSYETMETQEALFSEELDRGIEIKLSQAPRRSEVRTEDPSTENPVDLDLTETRISGGNTLMSRTHNETKPNSVNSTFKGSSSATPLVNLSVSKLRGRGLSTSALSPAVARPTVRQHSASLARPNHLGTGTRTSLVSCKDSLDAIPPASPIRVTRLSKQSDRASFTDPPQSPEDPCGHLSSPKPTRTEPLERTPQTLGGQLSGSWPHPQQCKVRSRPVSREVLADRERPVRMPKFDLTPPPRSRPAAASKASTCQPDSRGLRADSNALVESTIGDSNALTPSHLPRPSPASAWLAKTREFRTDPADPLALSNTFDPLDDPVNHGSEIPLQSRQGCLSSGLGTSADRAQSMASTDVFVGFRSPYSYQIYDSLDRRSMCPVGARSARTDHQSTENSTGELSDLIGSNEGTPYPFPDRQSSTGLFGAVEKQMDPHTVAFYPNRPEFNAQIASDDRQYSYCKTQMRHCASAETRVLCESDDLRKDRLHTRTAYSKMLRCLSLQWCFGN